MILKNISFVLLMVLISFSCLAQKVKITDKDIPNKEIIALLNQNEKTVCKVPMSAESSFEIKNSGSVNKLTNIGNAEKINVNNNGGTLNTFNTHVTYIFVKQATHKDSLNLPKKAPVYLYSPEKSEEYHRKNFEKETGLKIKNSQTPNSLKEKITLWKDRLTFYAKKLDSISNTNDSKPLEILKKYKENIRTASCLDEDYIDQAVIETDELGKKNYLFDIEKIKADPNYLYVGELTNGFRVIKKRNKFGYLKDGDFEMKNTVFKYDYAENYHPSGYAVAYDNEYTYLIDEKGNEKFSFDFNNYETSIQIINKNRFLIQNTKEDFVIDSIGKLILSSKHRIEPINDSKNYVFVEDSISYKKLTKLTYGVPVFLNSKKVLDMELESPDKLSLLNFHISDLNGKNISEKYENDKEILKISNCNKRDFDENYDIGKKDFLVLKGIFNIPDSNFLFLSFLKARSKTFYYVIKDIKSNEILDHADLNSGKNSPFTYSFFPIKKLTPVDTIGNMKDVIIGCKNTYFFAKNNKQKDPITIDNLTLEVLEKTERKESFYIHNLSQRRFIGGRDNKGFHSIQGSINNHQSFIVSKKGKDNNILKGVIDYNGLYIIPPMLEKLQYNLDGSFYNVKTFKNDNIYELDSSGKCIKGNCIDYNEQIKSYFNK